MCVLLPPYAKKRPKATKKKEKKRKKKKERKFSPHTPFIKKEIKKKEKKSKKESSVFLQNRQTGISLRYRCAIACSFPRRILSNSPSFFKIFFYFSLFRLPRLTALLTAVSLQPHRWRE